MQVFSRARKKNCLDFFLEWTSRRGEVNSARSAHKRSERRMARGITALGSHGESSKQLCVILLLLLSGGRRYVRLVPPRGRGTESTAPRVLRPSQ